MRQSQDLTLLSLTFNPCARNNTFWIMDPFESLNKVMNPFPRKIHTHTQHLSYDVRGLPSNPEYKVMWQRRVNMDFFFPDGSVFQVAILEREGKFCIHF